MSTEKNNFEVRPTDWGRALRRLTAINNELALTLTSELVKILFYLGRGLCPLPMPPPHTLFSIPPPYC